METLEQLIQKNKIADLFDCYSAIENDFYLKTFQAKERLLVENPAEEIYFFVDGLVMMNSGSGDGKNMILQLGKGLELVGDIEFLNPPGIKDTVYIDIAQDSVAIVLRCKKHRELLLNDRKFLRFLSENLAKKCVDFQTRQLMNSMSSARVRVANLILSEAEGDLFVGNHRIMAELLGMSYRHFHRVLHAFWDEGLIEKCENGYRIHRKLLEKEIVENQ